MANLFMHETACLKKSEVRVPPRILTDIFQPLRQLVPIIPWLSVLDTVGIQSSIALILNRISADECLWRSAVRCLL